MMSAAMPQPRPGVLGAWDRFVGPGMGWQENTLVIGSGTVGAGLAAWALLLHGAPPWLVALGALIALDVIGGAVCNATQTTKRWYHRPGATLRDHVSFTSLHVLHIVAVAWAFRGPGLDFAYALGLSATLITAMLVVLATPRVFKLPVAVVFYLIAIALTFHVFGATPGLEWFVPALFVKLLIGHLVP